MAPKALFGCSPLIVVIASVFGLQTPNSCSTFSTRFERIAHLVILPWLSIAVATKEAGAIERSLSVYCSINDCYRKIQKTSKSALVLRKPMENPRKAQKTLEKP